MGDEISCSNITTDCMFLTPKEEKKVTKSKNQDGDFVDRTGGDRNVNFALQLTDYDINEWRIKKRNHNVAAGLIAEFIEKRAEGTTDDIEVTITGSASLTGKAEDNRVLACKRANCAKKHIIDTIQYKRWFNRVKFDTSGDGFLKARCKINPRTGKNECELPEYRSVLIQVHAPGKKPGPIPIVPSDLLWNKFKVRCCSYKSEQIASALIGDLLDKALPSEVPGPIRDMFKSKAIEWIKKAVKDIIKKNAKLTKFSEAIGKALRFLPISIIRDKAVFQIIEREKTNPKETTLCFKGYGFRILNHRDALDAMPLPDLIKKLIKKSLEEIPGFGKFIKPIESTTPGPYQNFDLNHMERLSAFIGDATIGRDVVTIGGVHLIFNSLPFRRFNPPRVRIEHCRTCACPDCDDNVVPLVVGNSKGLEFFAVTEGKLEKGDCRCIEPLGRRGLMVRHVMNPMMREKLSFEKEMEDLGLRRMGYTG